MPRKSAAFKKASQAARRVCLKGKQNVTKTAKTVQAASEKTAAQHIPTTVPILKSQMRARATGLEPAQVRCRMKNGWPIAMFNLLALCMTLMPHKRTYDRTEFVSGIASITKRWADAGYNSFSFDRIDGNRFEDLSQTDGFLTAIWMCLSVRMSGLCHWGTVCSSWVLMSRGTSGRSEGHPWGLALEGG